MRRSTFVISYLFFATVLAASARAEEARPDTTAPDTAKVDAKEAAADSSAEKEKKKKKKTFEEVTKDFDVVKGLFTVYRKDDEAKVYLEIKPRQFDRLYLCAVTREAADGYFFDATALIPSFMNYGFPFILKRIGKNVQFLHKNVYFRADEDAPIADAVRRSVTNSILSVAKIVESEPHPERKSILVDAGGFFLKDLTMVAAAFKDRKVKYKFDGKNSYFGKVKSFPLNTEIEVVLHFNTANPNSRLTPSPTHAVFSTFTITAFRRCPGQAIDPGWETTGSATSIPYTRITTRFRRRLRTPGTWNVGTCRRRIPGQNCRNPDSRSSSGWKGRSP